MDGNKSVLLNILHEVFIRKKELYQCGMWNFDYMQNYTYTKDQN